MNERQETKEMDGYKDDTWPAIPPKQLQDIAVKIAQAVVAGLPTRTGSDEASFPAAARLAHSLFSELRFGLGTSDVINGKAKQLLPIAVTEVDKAGKGKIKYKRDKLLGLGAKSLTVAYIAGAPQIHEIPATGDEITISLDKANAVAVTLWDDVWDGEPPRPMGAPTLVSFVTYP